MRQLDDYRVVAEYYTGKASDVARTLALSGLAIIWIFKQDGDNGPQLSDAFFAPALWLVVALVLDLLQYVIGAVIWTAFHRRHELRGRMPEDKVSAHPFWPRVLDLVFGGKVLAVGTAYCLLLAFLLKQLFPTE